MDFKQRLGAKIKELRKENKYSQEHFAELVNMNPRQIVRIENGENMPSPENLEKIAGIFNIETEELFINSACESESYLRSRIAAIVNHLTADKLKALYLIAINL